MMLVASVRNGPETSAQINMLSQKGKACPCIGPFDPRKVLGKGRTKPDQDCTLSCKDEDRPPMPQTGLPSERPSQVEYAFQFAKLFLVGDAEFHGRVDFEKRKNTFPPSVDDPV